MKSFKTLSALFLVLLTSTAFSQSQLSSQTLSGGIQALEQANAQRLEQLETLETFYHNLSAEVVLTDSILESIKLGVVSRASCTASCAQGSVTCSGDIACSAEDGVGCAGASGDGQGGATISVTLCNDGPNSIGIR